MSMSHEAIEDTFTNLHVFLRKSFLIRQRRVLLLIKLQLFLAQRKCLDGRIVLLKL